MPALIDITGRTYGSLTVLKASERKVPGRKLWVCQCECGTIKEIGGSDLTRGMVRSCGCKSAFLNRETKFNGTNSLEGFTSGLLTFIRDSRTIKQGTSTSSKRKALFRCACGNEKEMDVTAVLSGLSKSCGCIMRKVSSERAKARYHSHDIVKDDSGRVVQWKPRKETE